MADNKQIIKQNINKIRKFIPSKKKIKKVGSQASSIDYIQKRITVLVNWIKLVIEGFLKNHCMLRASALTYTTILSIVPFLAVAFSILKGFGFQDLEFIQNALLNATGSKVVTDQIIGSIANANVGALGAIGVGTLLFTVISLLGNIEKSFNVIWGIKKGRTLGRKFTDYLSVTLVAPLFMIVAISASASSGLTNIPLIQTVMNISTIKFIINLIPYLFLGFVLTFLYVFLTNTAVKFKYAFFGGAITGIILQLAQWGFLKFGVSAAKANSLYQAFAPLLIFFLWVYISWVIILLGSVMSFAFQNYKTFQKEAGASNISNNEKQRLATKILLLLTKNFESDNDPLTNENISNSLNMPITLVNDILYILEKSRVVIEIDKEGGEYFSLIRPPERIFIKDIINYFGEYQEQELKPPADKEYKFITGLFDKISKDIEKSKMNINLLDIIKRVG